MIAGAQIGEMLTCDNLNIFKGVEARAGDAGRKQMEAMANHDMGWRRAAAQLSSHPRGACGWVHLCGLTRFSALFFCGLRLAPP